MTARLTPEEIEELERRQCGDGGKGDFAHVEVPKLRILLATARRSLEQDAEIAALKAELKARGDFDGLVRMRVADIIMERLSGMNSADAWWIVDAAWKRATEQQARTSSPCPKCEPENK